MSGHTKGVQALSVLPVRRRTGRANRFAFFRSCDFSNSFFHSAPVDASTPLHFLAIGGTGDVLGGAVKALLKQGHRVSLMSRSEQSIRSFSADLDKESKARVFPVIANYADAASIEKALSAYAAKVGAANDKKTDASSGSPGPIDAALVWVNITVAGGSAEIATKCCETVARFMRPGGRLFQILSSDEFELSPSTLADRLRDMLADSLPMHLPGSNASPSSRGRRLPAEACDAKAGDAKPATAGAPPAIATKAGETADAKADKGKDAAKSQRLDISYHQILLVHRTHRII